MVLDERRDLVNECARCPQPSEQRAGRGHPLDIVSMRSDPAIDPLRGRRLAEVVAERAEHEREVLASLLRGVALRGERCGRGRDHSIRVAFAGSGTSAQGGCRIEDHQGVHPDVAFRVPFRVLRDSAQGVDLGEEAELARVFQDLEADRGLRRAKQQLPELVEYPLAGEIAQIELPAQCDERIVRGHFKAGRELGHAQSAQRILAEVRRIGGAQHAAFQIAAPCVRVQHLAGEGVDADAVHREVAAARGLGEVERRVRRHVETAMSGAALAVAPREREVDADAADPEHAERAPDRVHLAEAREQRFEPLHAEAEHLDVDILRSHAQKMVAHPAAHDDGPAAGIADRLRDLDAPCIEP